ncbi:hypothetical protein AR457_38205 [Streptomyces agglomeratus]|nr:hypothetical protein [Streptomyces agglomeratus]OEJ23033.1 hypothetical protein AR457_38205 [Streptomyces agglomeratus]
MVQVEAAAAFGDQPFMPGGLFAAVVDHQLGGEQHHADSPADEPDRHRVAVGADADLAVAVDPQPEEPTRLEWFVWQRVQQRPLGCEILADRAGPGPDPPDVVSFVPPLYHLVELGEGVDFRDGDEVVSAEPADLALDPALLVGPRIPGCQ